MRQFRFSRNTIAFVGLLFFTSCGGDDPAPVKNARFAMMVTTDFTNGSGILIALDSLGGVVDATATSGISFSETQRLGIAFGDAIYNMFNTAGEVGVQKYTLSGDGLFQDEGFIVGSNSGRAFHIVSETEGYYYNVALNDRAIQKFNPSTMERTGSIDLSSAIDPLDTDEVRAIEYATTYVSGGKLYTNVQFEDENSRNAYDSVMFAVVDLATEQFEGWAIFEGQKFYTNSILQLRMKTETENGDIYFGAWGSDGNFFDFHGDIIRINAGETDFDPDWHLELEGEGLLLAGPVAYKNKLYTRQSDETLSPTFDQDFFLYETDPVTLENRKITAVPASNSRGAFGEGPFIYQDKIWVLVGNDDFMGYYTYDPESRVAERALEVVGGVPTSLFILQ